MIREESCCIVGGVIHCAGGLLEIILARQGLVFLEGMVALGPWIECRSGSV